jgi:5-methylcytosine-specific restriction endonuclease McrA
VTELLGQGLTQRQIALRLGLAKSTVAYHVRRLGQPADQRFNRRYDWSEVQRYYDLGHSVTQCITRFGFSRATWYDAVRRRAITPRPASMSIEELLSGPKRNRRHVRKRLIRAGLKAAACEVCGLTEWRGRPISLQLHHVNGDGGDNRIENLQIVCPNCHSQTDTWGGRNRKHGRQDPASAVAAG